VKLIRTLLILTFIATPLLAQKQAAPQQTAAPVTEAWTVDKAHSSAEFKVRHFMANVTGRFKSFDAVIHLDRTKPANSSVEFTIDTPSIDTNNNNRDEHLRSPDFFDVAKFPTITFKSVSIAADEKTKDLYQVTGDLSMHGVTKRVTLPVQFLGFGRGPRGGEKAGFEIETTINRKDFGITWNRTLDEGGVMLGDDVKVTINLELNKKQA
jgi:polyisoprenoid-binding protein YceI